VHVVQAPGIGFLLPTGGSSPFELALKPGVILQFLRAVAEAIRRGSTGGGRHTPTPPRSVSARPRLPPSSLRRRNSVVAWRQNAVASSQLTHLHPSCAALSTCSDCRRRLPRTVPASLRSGATAKGAAKSDCVGRLSPRRGASAAEPIRNEPETSGTRRQRHEFLGKALQNRIGPAGVPGSGSAEQRRRAEHDRPYAHCRQVPRRMAHLPIRKRLACAGSVSRVIRRHQRRPTRRLRYPCADL